MKILFLDDDLTRHDTFKNWLRIQGFHEDIDYTFNATQAINALKEHTYDLIFLDHDLGSKVFVDVEDPNTGSKVAKFIVANKSSPNSTIFIHSFNPVGAENMEKILINGGWTIIRKPFNELIRNFRLCEVN